MNRLIKRQVLPLALSFSLLSVTALAVRADTTPLAAFLHARHSLAGSINSQNVLPVAEQDPQSFLGHIFEVSATVSGLLSANGKETAMLTVGKNITLSAALPQSLVGASWIDSGTSIRALVEIEPTGNDQYLGNLQILSAAPAGDVEEAEQEAAYKTEINQQKQMKASLERSNSLPSRSLSAPRQEISDTTVSANEQPTSQLSAAALSVYPAYRHAVSRLNPNLSAIDADTITTWILKASDYYKVDPRLVMAMIIAESGFHINSTSDTGAMGLGQLMPETARGLGVTNAYDPVQNIAASVRLLRGHLQQYGGKISLTMAAYNAGPGAVQKYHGVPPYRETQNYVAKVTALYHELCGN